MKERKPSPVRTLARRYAAGELDHREYLRERRALLDDICSGIVALPDEDIPPTPQRLLMRETTPDPAEGSGLFRRPLLWLCVLVALAVLGWWLWGGMA
jgi:hypothetical protein